MSDLARSDFSHTAAYADDERVLIQSTCKLCGAHALVSIPDGSAKLWETTHKCLPLKKAEPRIERDS
jgi:hypothetical protein